MSVLEFQQVGQTAIALIRQTKKKTQRNEQNRMSTKKHNDDSQQSELQILKTERKSEKMSTAKRNGLSKCKVNLFSSLKRRRSTKRGSPKSQIMSKLKHLWTLNEHHTLERPMTKHRRKPAASKNRLSITESIFTKTLQKLYKTS